MPLSAFLTTLFGRLVVTSTQVELQFSKHTALTDTRSKRLGLGGLAAKAMNHCFKAWVQRWRDSVLSDQVPANTSRSRPAWTKTENEGSRKQGLHVYKERIHAQMKASGELDDVTRGDVLKTVSAAALAKWPGECEEVRKSCEEEASQVREASKATAATLQKPLSFRLDSETKGEKREAPLGMACLDGPFPARPLLVEAF